MSSEKPRCRLCMYHKPYLATLFRRNLSMKVMELADVEVMENDGLPTVVCIDCENAVEKCFSFRTQIQWADKQFREEMSVSLVDVEECNIKEEHGDFMEDDIDLHSDSGHNDGTAVTENTDETGEKGQDEPVIPLDHVEVMETIETGNQVQMIDDPQGQAEPLIEAPFAAKEEERALDPLICTKEEDVLMESDTNSATQSPASTSSFPVNRTVPTSSFNISTAVYVDLMNNSKPPTVLLKNQDLLLLPYISSSNIRDAAFNNNSLRSFPVTKGPSFDTNPTTTVRDNKLRLENKEGLPSRLGAPLNNYSVKHFSTTNLSKTNTVDSLTSYTVHVLPLPVCTESEMNMLRLQHCGSTSVDKLDEMPILFKQMINSSGTKTTNSSDSNGGEGMPITSNKTVTSGTFCTVCYLDCGSLELLEEHLEKKECVCRMCTLEFNSHEELETHFFNHKKFKCNSCLKIFYDRKSLYYHRKTTDSCNYYEECDICKKKLISKRILKRHKLLFHSGQCEILKFKCIICSSSFRLKSQLNNHLQNCHTAYEHLTCKFCKKVCYGPKKLKVHIKMSHISMDLKKMSACSICGKLIMNSHNMKKHMETHNAVKERSCEICGKSIKGKYAMANHMKQEHPKLGIFICKHCNQEFDTQWKLEKHKKKLHSNHSDATRVFCEICGKSYKTSDILKKHRVIHFDDKPFKCEVCGASFKQIVALRTHSRVHSNIDKYSCDNCEKTFRWKQTFDKHTKKCLDDETVDD